MGKGDFVPGGVNHLCRGLAGKGAGGSHTKLGLFGEGTGRGLWQGHSGAWPRLVGSRWRGQNQCRRPEKLVFSPMNHLQGENECSMLLRKEKQLGDAVQVGTNCGVRRSGAVRVPRSVSVRKGDGRGDSVEENRALLEMGREGSEGLCAQELVGVGRDNPRRKWEFREVIIAQRGGLLTRRGFWRRDGDSQQSGELQFLGWERDLERELLESEVGGGRARREQELGEGRYLTLWLSKP